MLFFIKFKRKNRAKKMFCKISRKKTLKFLVGHDLIKIALTVHFMSPVTSRYLLKLLS